MAKRNKLPTQTECLLLEKEVVFTTKGSSFLVSGATIREALEKYAGKIFFSGFFPSSRYAGLMSATNAVRASLEDLEECEKLCKKDNVKADRAKLLLPNIDDGAQYTLSEQEAIEIFL